MRGPKRSSKNLSGQIGSDLSARGPTQEEDEHHSLVPSIEGAKRLGIAAGCG